jgi:hypothetical protein
VALINCLDCGQPVSEQAGVCPHCGRPPGPSVPMVGTPAGRAQLVAITGCIVILAVVAVAGFLLVFAWDEIVAILRMLAGR